MTNLTTLAARIEAGTAEQQRELLEAAYREVFPEPEYAQPPLEMPDRWDMWQAREWQFSAMLDCSAYESAARMFLHNVGVLVALSDIAADGMPYAVVGCPQLDDVPGFSGAAATPALALAAACLRARASVEGDGNG